MRDEITKIFINEITPYLNEIKSIAVVGGSEKDPEAKILSNALPRHPDEVEAYMAKLLK